MCLVYTGAALAIVTLHLALKVLGSTHTIAFHRGGGGNQITSVVERRRHCGDGGDRGVQDGGTV